MKFQLLALFLVAVFAMAMAYPLGKFATCIKFRSILYFPLNFSQMLFSISLRWLLFEWQSNDIWTQRILSSLVHGEVSKHRSLHAWMAKVLVRMLIKKYIKFWFRITIFDVDQQIKFFYAQNKKYIGILLINFKCLALYLHVFYSQYAHLQSSIKWTFMKLFGQKW